MATRLSATDQRRGGRTRSRRRITDGSGIAKPGECNTRSDASTVCAFSCSTSDTARRNETMCMGS